MGERSSAEGEQQRKLEAIGALAGGMAHAFNNILGAMLGYTQMAKVEAAAVPEALESLDEVLRAGQRAKDLIQKLLIFSRGQPSERRALRLEAIVDDVLRSLRSTLPANIALSVSADSETDSILGDRAQLQLVLESLLANALRALHGRVGTIAIQLQNSALQTGKCVQLTVSDDGCGMEAALLERIFEPFFSTKTPGEGSGLGLSVVHGIVTDHHGEIQVESQPGVGSSFRVLLPAAGIPSLL
jgi:signal transduction histidine kinase